MESSNRICRRPFSAAAWTVGGPSDWRLASLRLRRLVFVVPTFLAWCSECPVQPNVSLIERRVVPRSSGFTLSKVDQPTATLEGSTSIYTVRKYVGGRLWLADKAGGRQEGWANADQVVLLENAAAFFSDRLRVNPRDIHALLARAAVYVDASEPDRAIADYSEAVRLDPGLGIAFNAGGEPSGLAVNSPPLLPT